MEPNDNPQQQQHHHHDNSSSAIKKASMRKLLPSGYTLGNNDVRCGRGQACVNHIGNQRFRAMIAANLDRYIAAKTKAAKTLIVYEMIDEVRRISPSGGFVKEDIRTGRYHEVGDRVAREKTSQAFRDAIKALQLDTSQSSTSKPPTRSLSEPQQQQQQQMDTDIGNPSTPLQATSPQSLSRTTPIAFQEHQQPAVTSSRIAAFYNNTNHPTYPIYNNQQIQQQQLLHDDTTSGIVVPNSFPMHLHPFEQQHIRIPNFETSRIDPSIYLFEAYRTSLNRTNEEKSNRNSDSHSKEEEQDEGLLTTVGAAVNNSDDERQQGVSIPTIDSSSIATDDPDTISAMDHDALFTVFD